jgi:hypothetical protein
MIDIDWEINKTLRQVYGMPIRIWQRYNFDAQPNWLQLPFDIQSRKPHPHRIVVSRTSDFGLGDFCFRDSNCIASPHFCNY